MRARTRATCRTQDAWVSSRELGDTQRGDPGEVAEIGTDQIRAGLIELRRL
jgi:hypothetical protein